MRLTLRTLLAYRDNVLSQEDRDELHLRIQQSQDATNLLHRVDSLTSGGQLVSPQLSFSGLGGDANTIAEYLDDSLHGPIVPELERVCLESDAHLAELAHCHRLLASALRTQVEVPEQLKKMAMEISDEGSREALEKGLVTRSSNRRGRRIRVDSGASAVSAPHLKATQPKAESSSDSGVNIQAPMIASGGKTISEKGLKIEGSELSQQVPEYLVGSERAKWKMPLLLVGLAVLLVVLLQQSLGPWQRVRELFAASSGPSNETEQPVEPDTQANDIKQNAAPDAADENADSGTGEDQNAEPEEPEEDIVAEDSLPPGLAPDTDSNNENDAVVAEAENAEQAVDPPAGNIEPQVANVVQWNPRDASESAAVAFLLREDGALALAEPQMPITAESKIVVPPTMRTKFDLRQGLIWLNCGPSIFSVDSSSELDIVKPEYCQALVSGANAEFAMETRMGTVKVAPQTPESIVSIDYGVRRAKHGSVQVAENIEQVLMFVAAEGSTKIEFQEQGQTVEVDLGLGEALAVFKEKPHEKFRLKNIPSWFRKSISRPVDELGIEDFRSSLSAASQGDMQTLLAEVAEKSQPETAALAMQTLIMLGDWKSASAGLFKPNMRSHWARTLDLMTSELRTAAASDRKLTLEKTKKALTDSLGADGDQALNLLLGPDVAAPKSLNKLISLLEESQIALRILAAYQLKKLTGETHAYQAHAPNRSSVQTWRRQLAMKKLNLLQPTLLPENSR